MAVQRALLLIADISGYTQFMKLHRMSLAHAQRAVAQLLEALIDASPQLKLIELEGDAAFFYAPYEEGQEAQIAQQAVWQVVAMHQAFHTRRQRMTTLIFCPCDGCGGVENLRVKFIAHLGEVASQRVKNVTKLAGFDVIVVHRLLKNDVPVPEYVLMTEPAFEHTDERLRQRASSIDHDLEGVGTTKTYFVDISDVAAEVPLPPRPSWLRRCWETNVVAFRSLPYLLGLRKPLQGFRNLSPN